jgi:predicted metal-dependent hydrolase
MAEGSVKTKIADVPRQPQQLRQTQQLKTPEYILKRSRRKTLCLVIRADGLLEVRSPLKLQQARINEFVREKSDWIEKTLANREEQVLVKLPDDNAFKELTQQTLELAQKIITRYSTRYPELEPASISIGRQKSRWGSCSSSGRIRLNACLAKLPEQLAEYVIVHELCHLRHLDHSAKFHALLQQLLPAAKQHQRELKRYRLIKHDEPVYGS